MKQEPPSRKPRGEPLPANVARALRTLLAEQGEQQTLRSLRVSRNALYRALAGMPVLLGTHTLFAAGLRISTTPPLTAA